MAARRFGGMLLPMGPTTTPRDAPPKPGRSRPIAQQVEGRRVVEGAGVLLRRTIASPELSHVDPFLLLDEFGSDDPDDYLPGFPSHPHRGIETVTYMLRGRVAHRDSLGNAGVIGPGDVQWMTAGGGIIHSEMPEPGDDGGMHGFQLWVNLPRSQKMRPPRYREVLADQIPSVAGDGFAAKIVAGEALGAAGPLRAAPGSPDEIPADPLYLDVALEAGRRLDLPVAADRVAIAYAFAGTGRAGPEGTPIGAPRLVVFGDGDRVELAAGDEPLRFLLAAGRPFGEPIARGGPFVMNTRAEIARAFEDYRNGTLVR